MTSVYAFPYSDSGLGRRRSPRLVVGDELAIRFPTSAEPLRLHDISFHGFSMWSAAQAVRGEVRLFVFRAPGQAEQLIEAVTVHVGPWPPLDSRGHFSGWFVESEIGRNFLESAIENLTRIISFRGRG